MKQITLLIVWIFMVTEAAAQLTGITPSQGVHGQTIQTTITGSGLFIQNSSPSGNLYKIRMLQGSSSFILFDYDNFWNYWNTVSVTDPNTVAAEIVLPINVPGGLYDLEVTTGDIVYPQINQTTYTLPGAFTILPLDGYITGTAYFDDNNDGIKDAGEPGIAGRMVKLLPNNVISYTDANGNYTFAVTNGNYSVAIFNSYNDYLFLTSANDTLSMSINNGNAPNNDFGLRTALISATPDTAYPGIATFHTLVADRPIFIPGANSYGNISSIRVLSYPTTYTYLTDATVIDSFTVTFKVQPSPNTALASNIDIQVILGSGFTGSHFLKQQFQIATPPSYVTGTVYHDLNRDGIKDAGEPGIQGRTVSLLSGGLNVVSDANGYYSFPSLNGNYAITVQPINTDYMFISSADTIYGAVTYDTSLANDIGLKRALLSITPDTAFQGLTTTHLIVADEPMFDPATIVYYVLVNASPNTFYATFSIVDSFTLEVVMTAPVNTFTPGNFDIAVRVGPGWLQTHYLLQQLKIAVPPSLISGLLFFDQNQNKIKDAGEPGIIGGKTVLTPDNSIGFSDNTGAYMLGSTGGQQTVTYDNNIPYVQLFTDSASYTFNAFGSVTGKDFGFISIYPDYMIDIVYSFMQRRCNTQQYASFKFHNLGNIGVDAVAWMKYDSLMTYISSPVTPSAISNDTIYWNISGLQPFVETELEALFQLPGAGDTVQVTYGIYSVDGAGAIQFADSLSQEYGITCAWDPNDKQVNPAGILAQHYTLMSDTLDYLIRFQNTGNDTAFSVVVLDTLDNSLDYNTFEIIGSSHSMQTELQSNGAVRFVFNNILLPDSNVNEPESHGFISYQIAALANLPDNTVVINTAHIFFDSNPPVVTNETINTLVYVLPTGIFEMENVNEGVLFYPNPFNKSAKLVFDNHLGESHTLLLTDILGKAIAPESSTTVNSFVIEKNKLTKGIYFYRLRNTKTNVIRTGKFIVD